MSPNQNSLGFFAGRQYGPTLSIQRFTGIFDFTAPPDVLSLTNTSPDPLDGPGTRAVLLKDVSFYGYFPLCIPEGGEEIVVASSDFKAVWTEWDFYVSVNGIVTVFPIVFKTNGDVWRSELFLARFDTPVNQLTVAVRNKYVDPVNAATPGAIMRLAANLEFYSVNP